MNFDFVKLISSLELYHNHEVLNACRMQTHEEASRSLYIYTKPSRQDKFLIPSKKY